MKKRMAGIVGTGIYLPDRIVTNFDLEKIVDTNDEWISTRTGIKERRIAADNQVTSDLATEAAKRAIQDAGIKANDIDLIIVTGLSPDMLFPSTACLVQKNLGIKSVPAFDVQAACTGFIYALSVAKEFIEAGTYKTILVIGAEIFSRILDWEDRNTCVLMADGAGATVLTETKDSKGILSVYLNADGSGADLIKRPGGGSRLPINYEVIKKREHYFKMSGSEVFKKAVKLMNESVNSALRKAKLKRKNIDWLIPHQANIRIIESLAKKVGIPRERVIVNLQKYGNTTAASIPIALHEAVKEGKIKRNDIVALVGFGGGLTWGASIIRW